MKKLLRSNKGAALAIVLIIFTVVAILGTIVLTIALSQNTLSVKTEDMTAAYYYSRSAVDIVSTDMQRKQQALKDAETAMLLVLNGGGTTAEKQAAVTAYNAKVTEFNALHLIPASTAETCTVQVADILPQPVTVNINLLADGKLQLSSEASFEGQTSLAKMQIGSFAKTSPTVTYTVKTPADTTWLGDDALYAWGDIALGVDQGANFTMSSSTSSQGTITAGGSINMGNKFTEKSSPEAPKTSDSGHDIPILVAPDKTSSKTLPQGTKKNPATVNATYNGKHGAFNTEVYWEVNTSGGDVVLEFEKFYLTGSSVINVTGSGYLYIYVKEPYAPNQQNPESGFSNRQLIYVSTGAEIKTDGVFDKSPKTFIIAYNDVLQWYHTFKNPGSTLIPAAVVPTTVKPVNYDTVLFENQSNFSAFFYLPGCKFVNENNSDLFGSVYASSMEIENNKHIKYYPFTGPQLFDNAGTTVGGTTDSYVDVTYEGLTPPGTKTWIR